MLTTTANLESRCRNIDETALPRTIEEAVQVTRLLGLRWLWIDGLCILQDSTEDKIAQMSVMGAIYHNAYATIAASHAHTSEDGFLKGRASFNVSMTLVRKPEEDGPACPDIDYAQMTPLFERAWTCQERMLSPHVLFFTSAGLFWSCQSSDRWVGNAPEAGGMIYNPRIPTFAFLDRPQLPLEMPLSPIEIYEAWKDVLVTYGRSSLGVDADKFPAISGVVSRFAKAYGDTLGSYLAGNWEAFLVDGLRWTVEPRRIFQRRPAFRAPSWSWAAVNGAMPMGSGPLLAAALRCNVVLETLRMPYGAVSVGIITVRGPVLEVAMGWARLSPGGYHLFTRTQGVENGPSQEMEVARVGIGQLDPGAWPSEVSFHCLALAEREGSGDAESEFCDGLILLWSPQHNFHVRAGWFRGFETFLALAEERTVNIA